MGCLVLEGNSTSPLEEAEIVKIAVSDRVSLLVVTVTTYR